MITWTRRLLLTVTIVGLLLSNLLTLTNAAFNAALSGLVGSSLGVRSVSSALQATIASQDRTIRKQAAARGRHRAATRKFGTRLATRTKRVAAKSIAAIPAESIPVLGLAVLIADTGYELYAACETMQDLDELYTELGLGEPASADAMASVCNPDLPDAGEVWDGLFTDSTRWRDQGSAR